jgi:hypothetical protein
MRYKVLGSTLLLLTITTLAAGQTKKWTPPRLADGRPDLQGFWTNSSYSPLERPQNVNKEFYTREEALELEKKAASEETEQTAPGTVADVHYDFTQFALDRNQSAHATNLRTSLITDPPDGRLPALTPEGQKKAADRAAAAKLVGRWDSAQSNDLDDRCMIFLGAGPPMLPASYNANYQIVQGPGYVMILFELNHDVRIIPIDNRPHLARDIRQWNGDSRGHWEGDTLVIETTNFNGKNPLRGSSENMRVVERFTRLDAETIQYRFTVEDESTWTRPWTAEIPMKKTIGPLFEHACHEGNYGLLNTLVGARLEEKKAAEEAAQKAKAGGK